VYNGRLLLIQTGHQLRLTVRTPRALTTGVVVPALLLVVSGDKHADVDYSQLAGLAVFGMSMTAWTTHGIGLVAARESGVLKRWRATPMPPACYFVARMAASVLVAVLAGATTVAIGIPTLGAGFGWLQDLDAVVALALGAIAWAASATAATALVPTVESAFPLLGLSYLIVAIASGSLGTVANLPSWVETAVRYLPARPAKDAVSSALARGTLPLSDVVVLSAWAIGGLCLAVRVFRWSPTRSRPRGLLRLATSRPSG
jgi:ABC-2 type transport system permease protein